MTDAGFSESAILAYEVEGIEARGLFQRLSGCPYRVGLAKSLLENNKKKRESAV